MEPVLAVFNACADATRLRLLFLLRGCELCVCELVAVLEMPQGKVSRHLAVLRQAGLVRDRRAGTWIHYSLAPPNSALTQALHAYLVDGAAGQSQVLADGDRLRRLTVADLNCTRATRTRGRPRKAVPGGADGGRDRRVTGAGRLARAHSDRQVGGDVALRRLGKARAR